MTYQDMNDRYRGPDRGRYEMAVREQGLQPFTVPAEVALAQSVTSGVLSSIDAVIAAICVGPNSETLSEDLALLAAVQAAWPTVAASIFG